MYVLTVSGLKLGLARTRPRVACLSVVYCVSSNVLASRSQLMTWLQEAKTLLLACLSAL